MSESGKDGGETEKEGAVMGIFSLGVESRGIRFTWGNLM